MLNCLGWVGWTDGGVPLSDHAALAAAPETVTVLRRIGALEGAGTFRRGLRGAPDGVTFAQAALRTWPT